MIHLQFLGTSAGVPTTSRNVSSVIFRISGRKHVTMVDCGEGTQQRLLAAGCPPARISDILITHLHGDHCLGLPGLISSRSLTGCTDALHIAGPQGLEAFIRDTLAHTGTEPAFPLLVTEADSSTGLTGRFPLSVKELFAESCLLEHGLPSLAWKFSFRPSARKLNIEKLLKDGIQPGPFCAKLTAGEDVRISDGSLLRAEDYCYEAEAPLSFVIAGDNARIDLLSDFVWDARLLIHEATFLREDQHKIRHARGHSFAEDLCQFHQKYPQMDLILTHFSPRYQIRTAPYLSENYLNVIKGYRNPRLHLAQDFMELKLSSGSMQIISPSCQTTDDA